jgi:hypothetical protein
MLQKQAGAIADAAQSHALQASYVSGPNCQRPRLHAGIIILLSQFLVAQHSAGHLCHMLVPVGAAAGTAVVLHSCEDAAVRWCCSSTHRTVCSPGHNGPQAHPAALLDALCMM